MAEFIKINPADNVAVAINDVKAGVSFDIEGLTISPLADIPSGHKMALCDIAEGENVVKYGFPIGHTLQAVPTLSKSELGYSVSRISHSLSNSASLIASWPL